MSSAVRRWNAPTPKGVHDPTYTGKGRIADDGVAMSATTPPPFVIRAATESDVPGVCRCLARAFEPFRSAYTPEAFLHTVLNEELGRERIASMRVMVAVRPDGEIVGTLAWQRRSPESGHLRGMAVAPELQGRGVAQALLDTVLAEMRQAGVQHVTLRTTAPLERAIRFYERNQFRPSGVLADFHGMQVTERSRPL
jgi:ribosomal protein S18 acetylase RimI-like enzyme